MGLSCDVWEYEADKFNRDSEEVKNNNNEINPDNRRETVAMAYNRGIKHRGIFETESTS